MKKEGKGMVPVYRVVHEKDLDELSVQASAISRRRKNLNLHRLEDRVQRFFNALEPGTYVRPHRHCTPPKGETFLAVRGAFLVVIYDDAGTVTDVHRLGHNSGTLAMDILPGTWHGVICEEPGTVYFEVKDGPYVAGDDKDFAPWAPEEGSEDAPGFLEAMHDAANDFMKKKEEGR